MENVDMMRLWRVKNFLCVTVSIVMLSQYVLSLNEEGQLLLSWKESLEDVDNYLGDWNASDSTPCLWNGVSCTQSSISAINFSNFLSLAGPISGHTFGKFANLTALDVGNANLSGLFPRDIVNCSKLVTLNLSWSYIGGEVPADISNLKQLQVLDLSFAYFNGTISNSSIGELRELLALGLHSNFFEGSVPESISSLSNLQKLTLGLNLWTGTLPSGIFKLRNLRVFWLGDDLLDTVPLSDLSSWENMESLRLHDVKFPPGSFPAGVEKMTQLTVLQLSLCNLTGPIPSFLQKLTRLEVINLDNNTLNGDIPDIFGGMANLSDFSVQLNQLSGTIPASLWQCKKLTVLFLYDNLLQGGISGIGNFSGLTRLDISGNNFSGPIPPALGNLTGITQINLSFNNLSGEIPPGVADWKELYEFRINRNQITGEIPYTLGTECFFKSVDLGSNKLEGLIPPNLCRGNLLVYLSAQGNMFTGPIPETYGNCTSLETLWLSNNQLEGPVPAGLWGGAVINGMFLYNNNLNGSIDASIGKAQSLSLLFRAGSNMLNGTLTHQLSNLTNLTELLLCGNSLSGSIPPAISNCKHLQQLSLSRNDFEGAIPDELADLPNLFNLDLSDNRLTGPIPIEFFSSLPLQLLNVAFNNLSGVIPKQENGQTYVYVNFTGNPYLCVEGGCNSTTAAANSADGTSKLLVLVVFTFFVVRRHRSGLRKVLHKPSDREDDEWTLTSFHRKTYRDYEVTALDEDNLIGAGGSGKVYKATLTNGKFVAVKKLWGVKRDERSHDHGFRNEVMTLANIRHRHIVKLLCCCTKQNINLLVYEYMPNGSLGDLLHSTKAPSLSWETRYKIAVGAAMGLQYLHHDCKPQILHRDIKSNNILLDLDYEAHLGDFGISKFVEPAVSRDSSTIAGSLGYIAPEYAFSTRVDEKSDIYSFGVVLLELVTGKRAVDSSTFGEVADLVQWVNNKVQTQEGLCDVLDPNCEKSSQEDMIAFLRVAILCTTFMPSSRPSMREVVTLLIKAAPKTGMKSVNTGRNGHDEETLLDVI
ncbi:hypothetical protein KC19_3G143200 [Ceratodon purpureus]|uniref:non-specific serine/threonine protein kinase n=1 Tax=Ceratodon purpureus TaxID=3225 RepID=A0A8T0IKW1_CERPU|nr:hypothetical protein KC19_3G143200 [Ceratodon purpureus]